MMFKIPEWGSGWSNWCLYCCHVNDINIASSPFISSSQLLYIQGCGRWKNFHWRFGSQGRRAINEHSCNIKQKKPLFLKNCAALLPHKVSQCIFLTCDNLDFQYFPGSSSTSLPPHLFSSSLPVGMCHSLHHIPVSSHSVL